MKNDLISRSELMEKIQFRIPNDRVLTDIVDSCVKITRRIIEEAPAVDAVPVVRCKDCKFLGFKDFSGICNGPKVCGIVKPYDFCSYGDRKEDGI